MIAALILAGGSGTRLGGADKAFVTLGGRPLIAHVIDRLIPQLACMAGPPRIAISANGDPARFAAYARPVLSDGRFAGAGPVAGLRAGLAWAEDIGAGSLLTIAVDTPFFPADLLDRLTPAPAVAVWRGRQHHLAAHWPTAALPPLTAFLNAPGPHRVRDALSLICARAVTFTAATDPFLNINTPADLAAAQHLAG